MFKLLKPDLYVEKVERIDLKVFKEKGYDTIILDLDNTLVSWKSKKVSDSVIKWLDTARSLKFKMCIVSNCLLGGRVKHLSEKLSIPYIPKAVKPRTKAFKRALDLLGSSPERTLLVGDQMFTDILGGNRMGLFTIMVNPVDKREFGATIIQRMAEKIVLNNLRKKGELNSDI
ncbi:MAG: YqeG family HAD IIIA-type phosphatase [Armatimonadota bacterium]